MRESESLNWGDATKARKNDAKLAARRALTEIQRGAIAPRRTANREVNLLDNCWTFVCK